MNPRPVRQPVFPTRARASRPARIGTLAFAFFFAVFVLLVWGMRDTAHAEDVVEPAPVTATVDEAATTPEPEPQPEAVAEEVAPVEEPTPAPVAVEEAVEHPVVPVDAPAEESVVVVEAPVQEPVVVVEEPVVAASVVVEEAVLPAVPADDEESTVAPAVVAPPAVHQCNADTFPTTAGWEATCVVTIVNTVGSDGATSSTVTTTWCLAEAGVLPPEGCDSSVVTSDQLVTTIDQCNGILAGGSNVTCTVEVVNNVPFGTPTTGVTVNQCIGSGQGGVSPDGPPTKCDPEDSSTTGATVTQCNGSANGGGAPERVQCTVAGAVTAVPVTVNQCNGSTAAGSTVTCRVTFTNHYAAAVVDSDTTPTPTPVGTTISSPVGDDETVRTVLFPLGSSSGSSSGSSFRGDAGRTATVTSLAATGGSAATLLAMAFVLLLLGCLLLAGSNRRSA